MAITVKSITHKCLNFEKKNGKYIAKNPGIIKVIYTKDGIDTTIHFNIKENFICDGASVPTIFTWFLPKWDKNNMIYNCGGIVHDCLYSLCGLGLFTRDECDDFIRGIWRCSGISRFKAGVADKCLQYFAGGKSHWGSDDLGIISRNLVQIEIY